MKQKKNVDKIFRETFSCDAQMLPESKLIQICTTSKFTQKPRLVLGQVHFLEKEENKVNSMISSNNDHMFVDTMTNICFDTSWIGNKEFSIDLFNIFFLMF